MNEGLCSCSCMKKTRSFFDHIDACMLRGWMGERRRGTVVSVSASFNVSRCYLILCLERSLHWPCNPSIHALCMHSRSTERGRMHTARTRASEMCVYFISTAAACMMGRERSRLERDYFGRRGEWIDSCSHPLFWSLLAAENLSACIMHVCNGFFPPDPRSHSIFLNLSRTFKPSFRRCHSVLHE